MQADVIAIHRRLSEQPFRPFQLRLCAGRLLHITRTDSILLTRYSIHVASNRGADGIYNTAHRYPLAHLEEIMEVQPSFSVPTPED